MKCYVVEWSCLPKHLATKDRSGVLQTMEFKNVDYWILKGMICIPEIPHFPAIQACEGMKHAIMSNRECTWKFPSSMKVYIRCTASISNSQILETS